jgi:hypothetical protein
MPSISPHMIVAKEVAKRLNINSDEFIRGNLLPDIIDIENSHHKIKSGIYMVPDIEYFLKTLDFTNDLDIGYLTHLLLDKHYLEDYLIILYPDKNIFLDGLIYKDDDYLNHLLVKRFKLDINYIEKALIKYDCKINEEKLKYNINCLKNNISGKTYYLNINSFSKFLKEVSKTISEELIEYANKSS